MTIFGPDIYNGQAGLVLARLTKASFVIAKTTEGTYYQDKSYQSWRRQAQSAGTLFAWYHFLTRENVQAQVANTKANVGDASLPGMLDIESAYGYSPTLQQVLDYIDAAHAAGLRLTLAYLPRWFWQQWGGPDLKPLRDRGMHIVNSSYPGGQGTPDQIYPGDHYSGWQGFGGSPVQLVQFTDQGLDAGIRMDWNAFPGDIDTLRALFYGAPEGGTDVNLTDTVTVSDGFARRYPTAANAQDGFTSGAQIQVGTLLEGAALRAVVNEHLITDTKSEVEAVSSKVDQMLAAIAKVNTGPGVDEAKLAADLGPLLHPTTDIDALVAAFEGHKIVDDAQAFAAALVPHIKVESA